MKVSEIFYSLQGEGTTRGIPAIFIRLAGCNLTCGIQSSSCDEEKATWKCDSYKLWASFTEYSLEELREKILSYASQEELNQHLVHIIWTGGEPLLDTNCSAIYDAIVFLRQRAITPYFEIETNGTIHTECSTRLLDSIDQVNCSPKLSNSGIKIEIRRKELALSYLSLKCNVIFKFVITSNKDWDEIQKDYLPYIQRSQIVLMPGTDATGSTDVSLIQELWALCEREKVKLSMRDHVIAWQSKVGV